MAGSEGGAQVVCTTSCAAPLCFVMQDIRYAGAN